MNSPGNLYIIAKHLKHAYTAFESQSADRSTKSTGAGGILRHAIVFGISNISHTAVEGGHIVTHAVQ